MYPIVDYFKTHDEVDWATVEKLCNVGKTTAVKYMNRLISLDVVDADGESNKTVHRLKVNAITKK